MATIGIIVGPVTAQRTFANDAKVSTALLKYFEHRRLAGADDPASLSNQEKLLRVVDDLVAHIQETIHLREMDVRAETTLAQVDQDIEIEFDFRA